MIEGAAARPVAGAARYARLYLCVVLPTMLLMCLVVPPFQGSDEPAHFLRALAVSRGQGLPAVRPHDPSQGGGPSAGGAVDVAARELALGFAPPPGHRYRPADLARLAAVRADGRVGYARHSNTAIYPPVAYLPAALAARVAAAGGAPLLAWLYAMRLAGAAVAGAIAWAAVRRGGDAAPALLIAAALPVCLFQGAVLTTDALLLPVTLLFGALLRRLATGEAMARAEHLALGATVLVIALAKVAYLPLVALPAIVAWGSDRRWSGRVRFHLVAGVLAALLWLGWAALVHDEVFPMYAGVAVDTPAQLALLRAEPARVAAALARTLARDLPTMAFGLTGARLGWNDLLLPKPIVLALALAWVAASMPAAPPARIGHALPAAALAASAACVLAIYLLLYLQFNAVGAATVEGGQARYLTPLAFLLAAALPRLRVGAATATRAGTAALIVAGVSAAITLVATAANYWTI